MKKKTCLTEKLRTSLLLLALTVMLPGLIISCKKKEGQNPEELTEELLAEDNEEKAESDFYSPAEDDASWVEQLLMRIEEERIADQLAEMEESYSDYQLEDDSEKKKEEEEEKTSVDEEPAKEEPEEKNPVEKFFEEAKEGKVITDKNSRMSFYEFDNEILVPQNTSEGLVVVRSTGENVSRNYYDEKSRLVKKEEWIIRSVEDARKVCTEKYTWSDEKGKVEKKDIITEDTEESVSYNDQGSPLSSSKYAVKDKKKFIISERKWKYDGENRVIKDEQKEYKYKDEKYKKLLSSFVRSYEYTYKKSSKTKDKEKEEDELPPDTKYFENGSLKKQTLYSEEKGKYISWVYFDESLSVKSYFEEDIRVKDEYYNKGKLFRTKLYEKPEDSEKKEKTDTAEETKTVIHKGAKNEE